MDKQIEEFANKFIAYVGEGENQRGSFPSNLSELNDDMQEFLTVYDTENDPGLPSGMDRII